MAEEAAETAETFARLRAWRAWSQTGERVRLTGGDFGDKRDKGNYPDPGD